MTYGTSLLLIAVGAILRFAVSVSTSGFNLHTIGLILIIIGAVGLVLSLLWTTLWADTYRRRRVVDDRPVDRPYEPIERY